RRGAVVDEPGTAVGDDVGPAAAVSRLEQVGRGAGIEQRVEVERAVVAPRQRGHLDAVQVAGAGHHDGVHVLDGTLYLRRKEASSSASMSSSSCSWNSSAWRLSENVWAHTSAPVPATWSWTSYISAPS